MLLLNFNASLNRYAIDSKWVVELIPNVELCKIPHAPSFLVGMLAYRGKVMPVIDLGSLFAESPCRQSLSTRIILVKNMASDQNRENDDRGNTVNDSQSGPRNQTHAAGLLGLLAERVYDLTYVKPEQIVPAPVRIPEVPYLDWIVQTDQGIVQLIAVDRLHDALHCGELSTPAPASTPQSSMEMPSEVEPLGLESGSS
jgi:chemotaxis-related protein WspB